MTFGEQIGINALNAGLGVIGGSITSAIQHKYNRELSEYQNAVNLSNWNRQNEYNSPINQRKRLEEAGLNPALMYGNGSTSTANAGALPAYQSFGQDITSNMLGVMQMAQMASNVRLTNAQAEGIEAENPYKGETAKAILDNYLKDVEVKDSTISHQRKLMSKMDVEINKVNKEIELLNEEITYRIAQTNSTNEQTKLYRAQEGLVLLQQVLTKEQTETTKAERGLVPYRKLNLESQNRSLNARSVLDEWEKEFIDSNGFKPDAQLVNQVVQLLSNVYSKANGDKGLFKQIQEAYDLENLSPEMKLKMDNDAYLEWRFGKRKARSYRASHPIE